MGDRLVVRFTGNCRALDSGKGPMVYLHFGGDVMQDVEHTLDEFLADVAELPDSRLADPSYLAAKLVVWAAWRGQRGESRLDFLSVGVVDNDGWGDAVAVVTCDPPGEYWIERATDMENVTA